MMSPSHAHTHPSSFLVVRASPVRLPELKIVRLPESGPAADSLVGS